MSSRLKLRPNRDWSDTPDRQSPQIQGVQVLPVRKFFDGRGYFFESYRRSWLPDVAEMVQGNVSFSKAGVLRGLHYHLRQADFWLVPSGHVRAALYDLRASSPTRGTSQFQDLGESHPFGLYIPPGVAHGLYTFSPSIMTYLVDRYYDEGDELGVRWNDPALGLAWGIGAPIVSARDRRNPRLAEIPARALPR
jgi:dTDP-4-dehydrorhamnose 3,5-epimerase